MLCVRLVMILIPDHINNWVGHSDTLRLWQAWIQEDIWWGTKSYSCRNGPLRFGTEQEVTSKAMPLNVMIFPLCGLPQVTRTFVTCGHCDICTLHMLSDCTKQPASLMLTANPSNSSKCWWCCLIRVGGTFCSDLQSLFDCQVFQELPDNTVAPWHHL